MKLPVLVSIIGMLSLLPLSAVQPRSKHPGVVHSPSKESIKTSHNTQNSDTNNPSDLLMAVLRDWMEQEQKLPVSQRFELLLNSLVALNTGSLEQDKKYVTSIANHPEVIQASGYKGKLESVITALNNYALTEAFNDIKSVIAQTQPDIAASESCKALIKKVILFLIQVILADLQNNVQLLDEGNGKFILKDVPIAGPDVNQDLGRRNQYIYAALRGTFTPLHKLLVSTAKLVQKLDSAKLANTIHTTLAAIEKQLAHHSISYLPTPSVEDQKVALSQAFRTFLVDDVQHRMTKLKEAASHYISATPPVHKEQPTPPPPAVQQSSSQTSRTSRPSQQKQQPAQQAQAPETPSQSSYQPASSESYEQPQEQVPSSSSSSTPPADTSSAPTQAAPEEPSPSTAEVPITAQPTESTAPSTTPAGQEQSSQPSQEPTSEQAPAVQSEALTF